MSKYEGEFTAYMKRVVPNAKVDYIRRNAKRKKEILLPQVQEDIDIFMMEDIYFESTGEIQFEEEQLERAFSGLSPLKRRILAYTYVDGLTAEEIANVLGCSVDNVYAMRSRAIKKIRSVIEKEGRNHEINRLR